MTVITWANFPEIKQESRGQDMAQIFSEMFLPPNYAIDKKKLRQIAQKIAKIGVLTGGILLSTEIDILAANIIDMEKKATGAYTQLVWLAKWAICIKGGWSTIHKMLQEDFDGAKSSAFQYLVIFVIVMAFPVALNYIEGFFK